MPTLMIPVDETKLKKLQQTASRLGVGVEELVQQSIDDFVYRRERCEDATKLRGCGNNASSLSRDR